MGLQRNYQKPPVVEALCEIYFRGSMWDDTIPGIFYEKVKQAFPKKQQREVQQAQITLERETATAGVQRLPSWIQFVSERGDRVIQIAENLLVVNQLRPYHHFSEWELVVYNALELYKEIAEPQKVDRCGIRYINRIEIPGTQVAMEDYFMIYPQLPESLEKTHGPFLVRVEIPQTEQAHVVLITFGTSTPRQSMDKKQVFLLDLYDIFTPDTSSDGIELRREIQRAHDNVVMAFEDSITDQLRKLFNQEVQK